MWKLACLNFVIKLTEMDIPHVIGLLNTVSFIACATSVNYFMLHVIGFQSMRMALPVLLCQHIQPMFDRLKLDLDGSCKERSLGATRLRD